MHSLAGGKHDERTFPETKYVPAIAGVDSSTASSSSTSGSGPGSKLIAAFHDRVVLLPSMEIEEAETLAVLIPEEGKSRVRLNDGACDPAGRFLVGSMNLDGLGISPPLGKLFSVAPSSSSSSSSSSQDTPDQMGIGRYEVKTLLEDIGCSNGIDWSPSGSTMYYIDSSHPRIDQFDYDVASGSLSNRRTFVTEDNLPPLPPAAKRAAPMVAFDGLTVDGLGNVWVARWGESRVVCFSPAGEALLQVTTPSARSPTIPCFGGERLDELYIATASAELAGEKGSDWPRSGDLFKLKIGEEMRKVLGEGWKGRARHAFRLA